MDLFTIKLELGAETRALIERIATETHATAERVATTAVIHLELGEKTRATIEALGVAQGGGQKTRDAVEGLVEKARAGAKRASAG